MYHVGELMIQKKPKKRNYTPLNIYSSWSEYIKLKCNWVDVQH